MLHPADLPSTLPIFPLPGALLLPRSQLPLHIFEPRYLAMLEDCLKTSHRLIGMVQPFGENSLHQIGCAGRVSAFSETQDGRYMISLSGVSRFRLEGRVDGFQSYTRHEVKWDEFNDDLKSEDEIDYDRESFFTLLHKFFDATELATDWESLEQAEDEMLINSLAMLCPFEPEDKQALLEAPTLAARQTILITLLEFALRGGGREEAIQ